MTSPVERDEFLEVVYPESDGKPRAENDIHYRWIVTIKENLNALLSDAYVAADLFWYPVRGNPNIKQAPDVMVAFGRPKGDRGSYRQWEEADVAPQVVFEILSPGNTHIEMVNKQRFYRRYGVEEYYEYDPKENVLLGWIRTGDFFREIEVGTEWISPRLGVRFVPTAETLELYLPDGSSFDTFDGLKRRAREAELSLKQERERADAEHARAERLAEMLRRLGHEPE